ncbi:MAG TPA: ATP-binding protein [Archangium sp.]|jgi:PAS domain S-box-containing protein|uniref:two-component system sensor histidine kinase NtrB n=1 Tax=Archangium sp. TaxID=1872627 RepID=UPI002ED9CD61
MSPDDPGHDEVFRLLVDTVEDAAVFMLGPDGRVVCWNTGGERVTGYCATEALGKHLSHVYLEEDLASGLPQRVLDEAEQQGQARTEGWRVRKDGSRFYSRTLYTALWHPDGRLRGFAGVTRDITARRETEARLREAQEALRRNELLSRMGALVAGVAHEVRNPLFGISATLEAFDARFGHSPEHAPYVSMLRREVSRLHQLMHGLLTYGRPPSTELHPCTLSSVLHESVDLTAALAREREVQVEVRAEPGLPRVPMDPSRLVQVFQNLLANALQHSPRGTTVRLTARGLADEAGPRVECLVMDQGPGFSPEELPRVFEPFFSHRAGGVGLGLAIVQRIVEEHHGSVSVGNGPEGGAEVRVFLPAEGGVNAAPDSGGR